MADLKTSLEKAGLLQVRTYIQSGNVIFDSTEENTVELTRLVEETIAKDFGFIVPSAVFAEHEWRDILTQAPKTWGQNPEWKHNLLVLLKPFVMPEVISAIGVLKPGIETLDAGDGVLYQSMSKALFGKTTTGRLASSPIYKRMTIRNYNTAQKLSELLDQRQ